MRPNVTLQTKDHLPEVEARLKRIAGDRVLVGIPEDKTARKAGAITNAQLMYIHTNGSSLRGIPPRPDIEPALMAEDNRRRITMLLGRAAQAELSGDHQLALDILGRAGLTGANAAKRWFTDPRNGWAANKRATIIRKARRLRGQTAREFAKAVASGEDLSQYDTPLIDTAQLRRAITFIVRG